MEQIRYTGRRFAEVLGLNLRELAAAEGEGVVKSSVVPDGPAQKTLYSVEDLAAAVELALGREAAS